MEIDLFLDETGSILNPTEKSVYGFGYVHLPCTATQQLHDILQDNQLFSMHLRETLPSEKITLAQKLGSLNLQLLGIRGGAVIRKDSSHAEDFIRNNLSESILDSPHKALTVLDQNTDRRLRGKIVKIDDLFPRIIANSRVMEYLTLATRYPVFKIIQQYGIDDPLHIKIYLSSIATPKDFHKRLEYIASNYQKQLDEFFKKGTIAGLFARNPSSFTKVSVFSAEASEGAFAVADLFGCIGRQLTQEGISNDNSLGSIMYEAVSALFPEGPTHKSELKKGIFVL